MRKALLIWIGLLFLLVDTRLTGLVSYPAYEPFDTPAPQTVDMIIGHLIGDSVPIDICSDAAAYLLILITASSLVNTNKKAFGAFAYSLIALILYAANLGMPFVLNGEARYHAGFFLYLACLFLKCLATIQAGLVCSRMCECVQNHAWNRAVEIFLILSAFAGFVRGMSFFYNLPVTTLIYYAVQTFFMVLCTIMFWLRRSYIGAGEA